MLPRAGTAAVHGEHQTAPYIGHIVDGEGGDPRSFRSCLAGAAEAEYGIRFSGCSVQSHYTGAGWDVLGGDAGREGSTSKARHKAGALSGTGPGYPATPQTPP